MSGLSEQLKRRIAGAYARIGNEAVDRNLYYSLPLHEIWPDLEPLPGDPRYEALLTRLHEQLEAERAELGLEPLNT